MKIKLNVPIWLKITLITAVIFFILSESFTQYFKNKSINDFKQFSQINLLDKAKLIASGIDGDEHLLVLMKSDSSQRYYDKIRNYLDRMKDVIGLSEEISTVFLHDERTTCYGIKSNTYNITGEHCVFRDSSLIPVFRRAFKENKPVFSEIYQDRNNIWLSGFAPFTYKDGLVAAVVEIDLNFNEYNAMLNDYISWSNYFRILGIFGAIILGATLGFIFGKPISNISKGMSLISTQDFSRKIVLSPFNRLFPDETATLTETFNQMSDKLDNAMIELKAANKKLDELDHSKSVFLNLIAHEMRTPLTGLGFIDYLKQHHSCNQEDDEIIQSISESYLRIKLFTASAEKYIRALNYNINPEAYCNLNETIKFSIMEKKSLAEERNIKFQYTIDEENCYVTIEEKILTEILNILFDNAMKFSNSNSEIEIVVNIGIEKVSLFVKDSGAGINPQSLKNIFNPYFVDDIFSHSKGSGVNLPITKILINKYDGEIIAKSEGDEFGSEFIISLKKYNDNL